MVYDYLKGTTTVIVHGLAYTFDIYTTGTDSPIPEDYDLEAEQQAEADSHDITKSDFGFGE